MIPAIVPTQHLGPADALSGPHKRLMAAVLQTVVDDCRGTAYRRATGYTGPSDLRGFREAIAYVASTDRAWPFSFENVCESLGMDAGCVREKLRHARASRQLAASR